jgi:hypothetical protein
LVPGLYRARGWDHDAIVLDVMIPAPDGFEVLRRLRAEGRTAPVLMLTARAGLDDRLHGLVLALGYRNETRHLSQLHTAGMQANGPGVLPFFFPPSAGPGCSCSRSIAAGPRFSRARNCPLIFRRRRRFRLASKSTPSS